MKILEPVICCFCFNLRTGALILGWLGTIVHFIAFFWILTYEIFVEKTDKDESNVLFWATIIDYVANFIISAYLLVGVYKNNAAYVKVYIYGIVLSLILSMITLGARLSAALGKNPSYQIGEMVGENVANTGKKLFALKKAYVSKFYSLFQYFPFIVSVVFSNCIVQ